MKGIYDTRIVQNKMGEQLRAARGKTKRPALVQLLRESPKAPVESKAEMTAERLKQWEYGNNPISLEWIPAICDVLDCDVGYLFGEYEEKKREFSDICAVTGLSEKAVWNLSQLKSVSRIGNEFYIDNVFCKAFSEEETPIWVINSLVEDKKILSLLYLFFVVEDMGGSHIVEHTRSNAILIDLIGILTNRRDCLEKIIGPQREVTNNG